MHIQYNYLAVHVYTDSAVNVFEHINIVYLFPSFMVVLLIIKRYFHFLRESINFQNEAIKLPPLENLLHPFSKF